MRVRAMTTTEHRDAGRLVRDPVYGNQRFNTTLTLRTEKPVQQAEND